MQKEFENMRETAVVAALVLLERGDSPAEVLARIYNTGFSEGAGFERAKVIVELEKEAAGLEKVSIAAAISLKSFADSLEKNKKG